MMCVAGQWLDQLATNPATAPPYYLWDWSVSQHCPLMLKALSHADPPTSAAT